MLHPHDGEMLQRLLKLAEVPPQVLEEYELRQSLFHRAGGSGPLGPLGLIGLVRHLGLGVREDERAPDRPNWAQLSAKRPRVEVLMDETWCPGVLEGVLFGGSLAIRLDGVERVHECRPLDVRLAPPKPKIDWHGVRAGQPVWVAGEMADSPGRFVDFSDGKALVLLDGQEEPVRYAPELLTLID